MPASRRSVSRAPRPQEATPSAFSSCQTRTASLRGQHDFEAVLAGVAGAGDEPAVDLAADERAERERGSARPPATAASRTSRALRALHGEHREIRALGDLDVEVLRVLADPREVLVARAGVDDHAEPVLA